MFMALLWLVRGLNPKPIWMRLSPRYWRPISRFCVPLLADRTLFGRATSKTRSAETPILYRCRANRYFVGVPRVDSYQYGDQHRVRAEFFTQDRASRVA